MMQSGAWAGMVTLNRSLADLVKAGKITAETAVEKCRDLDELAAQLGFTRPEDLLARLGVTSESPPDQRMAGT